MVLIGIKQIFQDVHDYVLEGSKPQIVLIQLHDSIQSLRVSCGCLHNALTKVGITIM